jgi:hypothetical protein
LIRDSSIIRFCLESHCDVADFTFPKPWNDHSLYSKCELSNFKFQFVNFRLLLHPTHAFHCEHLYQSLVSNLFQQFSLRNFPFNFLNFRNILYIIHRQVLYHGRLLIFHSKRLKLFSFFQFQHLFRQFRIEAGHCLKRSSILLHWDHLL